MSPLRPTLGGAQSNVAVEEEQEEEEAEGAPQGLGFRV